MATDNIARGLALSAGATSTNGKALTPASVAATGNITAAGTTNRFGPQTGTATGTLYLDSANNNNILQGIFWSSGNPFNAGQIVFSAGSNVVQVDNQSSSGYTSLAANGTAILKVTSAGANVASGALLIAGTSAIDASRNGSFVAVAASGAVTSSSASAGNGYATGAGGTVTQLTNKSTGVTLNKVCGQITMNNAALAAGAKVSFVVSNTSCAATDIPAIAVVSGGTANAYRANVTAVASNSFTITVENITAGSLSEAPVIGFAVQKAVTA
jgi:hypothetical protein